MWERCLSLDSIASKVRLVVDRQVLGEGEYRREEDEYRPANLSLQLGYNLYPAEYPVKITDLNVFSSSLSVERMVGLTRSGNEECGTPGDLVSWEEAEWTLHSQAKVIEVDKEWEGSCRRESQVQVFALDMAHWYDDCMRHCEKIDGPVVFNILDISNPNTYPQNMYFFDIPIFSKINSEEVSRESVDVRNQ